MLRKFNRTFGLALTTTLAVMAFQTLPNEARSEPVAPAVVDTTAHIGTFVSASGNEFTMQDSTGQQHKHTLAAGATVTDPNGNPCKLTDLKADQKIKVTTSAEDKSKATKVECVA